MKESAAPTSSEPLGTDDHDEVPPFYPDAPETRCLGVVRDPTTRRLALVAIAKRTYALGPGRLSLADEQVPITTEPVVELDARDRYRALRDDIDVVAPKACTDVVVSGSVHARFPSTELQFAVAVGPVVRRLRAVGVRHVELARDGTPRFSPPGVFESIPLGYAHAYGGYDDHAQRRLGPIEYVEGDEVAVGLFAYPRNEIGRGYFIDIDRRRAEGALLPQLEDPADPLTPSRLFLPRAEAWIDAPIPASLGFLPHAYYPRFVRLLGPRLPHDSPSRPIRESTFADGADLGDVRALDPGRIHPRAIQSAAPGLASARLRGDETVRLESLHPGHAELTFELPGETPRFYVRPPNVKVLEPEAVLQTVRIEPDRGLVSLTFCAAIPLGAPVSRSYLARIEFGALWRPR